LVYVIAFAALWFLAGYLATLLVGHFSELPLNPAQFGLISVLIGLIALVSRLQTEQGRQLFFEGPEPDEDGDLILGCLWAIPLQVLLVTLIGWGVWLLFQIVI
jgi:hypothetical protein